MAKTNAYKAVDAWVGVGIRHKSGYKSIWTGAFTRAFDDECMHA